MAKRSWTQSSSSIRRTCRLRKPGDERVGPESPVVVEERFGAVKVTTVVRRNAVAMVEVKSGSRDLRKLWRHTCVKGGITVLETVQDNGGSTTFCVSGSVDDLCSLEHHTVVIRMYHDVPSRGLQRMAMAVREDGHVTVTAEGASPPKEGRVKHAREEERIERVASDAARRSSVNTRTGATDIDDSPQLLAALKSKREPLNPRPRRVTLDGGDGGGRQISDGERKLLGEENTWWR